MSEETKQETQEETKEEPTSEDAGEGDKPKSSSLIERASSAAERLEKANAQTELLVQRQEDLMARRALEGTTDAGKTEKKVEVSPEEYAQKVLKGEINPFGKESG